MIVCAGNSEVFEFATPMGVGLTDMSINLTRACLMDVPKYLLFVGTAGSYGAYKPMDIVYATHAANVELAFLDKHAYTPIDNVIAAQGKTVQSQTIVNSSNYITTDISYGEKFLGMNIGLENMEFFAFLKVAQAFGIPAGGVFVVTNYTDTNAHHDFMTNHAAAMQKLTQHIYDNLHSFK